MDNFHQMNHFIKQKPKEINLKELFHVLKRRYLVLLTVIILASIAGFLYSQKPVTLLYQTSTKVIINANAELSSTLQVVIKDSTVLDKVIEKLHLNESSDELANQITVSTIGASQVVSINVVDPNPKLAAKIANTTAQVFKEEVPKIIGQDDILLLSEAKVNYIPINENTNNKIPIFIISGLVLGIVLVFFLDSLDDTIQSEIEAELLFGLPVLGKVSKMKKRNTKKSKMKQYNLELRGEANGFK